MDGNPLPELALKCIESWKKYLPDYEIIEWNENNFDIHCNKYVEQAYESKKYAFVSDYARLYAMYEQGGIYMDTDVEVIKNLDAFLSNKAFSGFESSKDIPTGIMACEKHFPLFKAFLNYYNGKNFILPNGEYDTTTNVSIITNICLTHGFIKNNMFQTFEGFTLYPSDYFCPKEPCTGILKITDNTHTIHHFSGSWFSDEEHKRDKKLKDLCLKYGEKRGMFLYKTLFIPYRIISSIKEIGWEKTFRKVIQKNKEKR